MVHLQVLCVLLLQNAGLKSKDTSARCLAIELLGTIASRLKRDSLICSRDKFWILQELVGAGGNSDDLKDTCSVCLGVRGVNIVCHVCGRCFHSDCLGLGGQENLVRDWSCHLCFCKKQLSVLESYYKIDNKDYVKRKNAGSTSKRPGNSDSVTSLEVLQQILLNYLQEAGSRDDGNLFTRWCVF